MRILVVGSGGREHALTWKLSTDSTKPEMFCAPGNAGTEEIAANLPIQADDIDGLVRWAEKNHPDLTVIGPEVPLCLGLTDKLEKIGLKVFGPSKDAAELEGSKVFSKEVMEAAGIPTAASKSFSDYDEALKYAETAKVPCVVKAEGLAAGKGVIICETRTELLDAVKLVMLDKAFGIAGNRMLIEDFLEGEEASILALIDGENILMLASSQDHKRIFDNDQGPNTGGMGAYSPAPIVTDDLWPVIKENVYQKTLDELKKRGITYRGVLYAGLMIDKNKTPYVLEFNCRFGDPETQVVLPRIEGDLLPAFMACAEGNKLTDDIIKWKDEHAVCVVMASGGYPGNYEKGKVIEGIKSAENDKSTVFQAGTKRADDKVITDGGRVLVVSSLGKDLPEAIKNAYSSIQKISFDGAFYRKDIGAKGLKKKDDRKSRYFWNAPEVPEASHSKNKIKESHKILNIGFIGAGGMGTMSLNECLKLDNLNIIALADVDLSHLEEAKNVILQKRPDADVQTFQDFRDLTKLNDIDAIIISTPDHWHVPAAINALEHGKHIYVEKPLTLTIAEGRELVDKVNKTGLVCQTGTQQRSSSEFRLACELVRNNKIGDVKEINVFIPENNVKCDKKWSPMPIPEELDYDMWLGQAPWEEYTEQRCHYSFRFILAYSGGQMTNWGAHHLDIVQWALDMDDSGPVAVSGKGVFPTSGLFDTATEIDLLYEYADGTKVTCKTADTRGIEFIGSKGKVFVKRGEIKTEPESLVDETFDHEDDIQLYVSTNHYRNFFDCVRQNKTPVATAEIGHRSATLCHLGNIAMTLKRKLQWDPKTEKFVNDDEANSMLSRTPRKTF